MSLNVANIWIKSFILQKANGFIKRNHILDLHHQNLCSTLPATWCSPVSPVRQWVMKQFLRNWFFLLQKIRSFLLVVSLKMRESKRLSFFQPVNSKHEFLKNPENAVISFGNANDTLKLGGFNVLDCMVAIFLETSLRENLKCERHIDVLPKKATNPF